MQIGKEILIQLDGPDNPPTTFYITRIGTYESGKLMVTIDGQNHCGVCPTKKEIIAERIIASDLRTGFGIPSRMVLLTATINPYADFDKIIPEWDIINLERHNY